MPFQVLPCLFQDLPTCSMIHWSAYASNPLWQILHPNGGTPSLQSWTTYHLQREFDLQNIYFYKVVEATMLDKVLGCAKWTVENDDLDTGMDKSVQSSEEEEGKRDVGKLPFHPPDVADEDSNEAFFNDWMPKVLKIRHRYLNKKQAVVLDDLAVLPDHQRQGAGTLLLNRFLDFADGRDLPRYLESTPLAQELYIRHRFQVIDTVEIDLGKWKQGNAVYKSAILYRDA